MSEEVLEDYKNLLIGVLNENIRLEEATKSMSGFGGVKDPSEKDKNETDNILMGSQDKLMNLGPAGALGLAAGGKLVGTLGKFVGKGAANTIAKSSLGQLFGGNLGSLAGSAAGNLIAKALSDVETLSGARGLEAQIGNIAPKQVELRWEGSGHGGWFNKLVPSTKIEKIKPETQQERMAARRKARAERLGDVKMSRQERRYGLPPLP